MKYLLFVFVLTSQTLFSQSLTGKWKTIDDESGKERSVVEIFEKDDQLFGRVTKIFPGPDVEPDPICKECPEDDARYRKKVIGMEIIRNMKNYGSYYADGDILDPKIGRIYKCRIWLEGAVLKVRGYWGPFYRTQTWHRLN